MFMIEGVVLNSPSAKQETVTASLPSPCSPQRNRRSPVPPVGASSFSFERALEFVGRRWAPGLYAPELSLNDTGRQGVGRAAEVPEHEGAERQSASFWFSWQLAELPRAGARCSRFRVFACSDPGNSSHQGEIVRVALVFGIGSATAACLLTALSRHRCPLEKAVSRL